MLTGPLLYINCLIQWITHHSLPHPLEKIFLDSYNFDLLFQLFHHKFRLFQMNEEFILK